METVRYELIDGDNNLYEMFLTSEEYAKAASDGNYATNILRNIKKAGISFVDKENNRSQEKERELDENENFDTVAWLRNATLQFLSLYQEYESQLSTGKIKQKTVFEKVAEKMAEEKYCFSAKQCMTKLTSMKRMYKKIKDHNGKSENDRQTWQYFEQMEEIFGKKPWVKPLSTLTSATNISDTQDIATTSFEPSPKRMKMATIVDKYLNEMVESKELSQEEKNKRHASTMQRLDILNSLLQKLIDRKDE